MDDDTRQDLLARHNLHVTYGEIRTVRQAIRSGNLLELVDSRARGHPTMLDGYRTLLDHADQLERTDPVSKDAFFHTSTESARRLHASLDVPVIVTDTCGRPFRHGQRGVAIGRAGLPASHDWRGEHDRDGRELGVTVEAIADELAAAANLTFGEGSGSHPIAVIEGFDPDGFGGSDELFRDVETDFVRQALREWSYARD
jgi:hypothetical protein